MGPLQPNDRVGDAKVLPGVLMARGRPRGSKPGRVAIPGDERLPLFPALDAPFKTIAIAFIIFANASPLGTGRRREGYASGNRHGITQRPQRRMYRPALVRCRCAELLSGDPIASFLNFEVRAVGQPFEAPATFLNDSPRSDVVGIARDQRSSDSERGTDGQRLPEHFRGISGLTRR